MSSHQGNPSSSSPSSSSAAPPQHTTTTPTTTTPEKRRPHHPPSSSRQHHPGHGHPHQHHPGRPLQPGQQRFGQYVIISTLGEGSFGKVKLAVHQQTGQKVALKIISRRKLINKDMAGRVEREIQYLQLLRHPHIIKLYVAGYEMI